MNWNVIAVLILILTGITIAAVLLIGNILLGPHNDNPVKSEEFECGSELKDDSRKRFNVKYYIVALLFVVFDLEVVYMYPWAVLFRKLGWFGFVEMLVFMGILVVGLVYVWKKGALDW